MPEEVWAMVEERAPKTPGRDRSGYIANLVEADLRDAGVILADDTDEINAAIKELGKDRALDVLRRAARKPRAA